MEEEGKREGRGEGEGQQEEGREGAGGEGAGGGEEEYGSPVRLGKSSRRTWARFPSGA